MSQQAGWYDDPQDESNLRYWDGVQWTDHTSPKQKPGLDRAGQAQQPWGGEQPGQQGYGQQQGPYGGQQQGWGQASPYGQQQNPYAGQTGQDPYQGQWQGAPMPGGYGGQGPARATTPDGQPLAGWWHRVGARIIDGILLAVVGGFLANLLVPDFFGNLMDWSMNATDPFAPPPAELAAQQLRFALVVGVLGLVYEIAMVALVGGTVGKLVTGLRVRLREQPGVPGWGASIIRGLIYQGVGLVSQLNSMLGFLSLFNIINVLWPLWDPKKQALHDKAAKTNVVRVR